MSPYVVSSSPGRELDADTTVEQEEDEKEISGEYEKPSYLGHVRGYTVVLNTSVSVDHSIFPSPFPSFPPPVLRFLRSSLPYDRGRHMLSIILSDMFIPKY